MIVAIWARSDVSASNFTWKLSSEVAVVVVPGTTGTTGTHRLADCSEGVCATTVLLVVQVDPVLALVPAQNRSVV